MVHKVCFLLTIGQKSLEEIDELFEGKKKYEVSSAAEGAALVKAVLAAEKGDNKFADAAVAVHEVRHQA